jgi:GNAT superfamily N-acetyltransferase
MPYLPELHSDEETRDWIAGVVLPAQQVWVAQRKGRVIGFAAVDGSTLEQLYVLPEEQGRGVGSALLAKAKEMSQGRLTLWTFQRNTAARAFYERRGFTAVEFTDGASNKEQEPDMGYRWVAMVDNRTK